MLRPFFQTPRRLTMIRTRRSFFLLSILSLALSLEGLVVPSTSAQVATGTPPFGSFGGGPDIINLASLNAHLTIPVLHKPGRGTNFSFDLTYDSSVWYPSTSSGTNTWTPANNWGWTGPVQVVTGYIYYSTSYSQSTPYYCQTSPENLQVWTYSNFVYVDARDRKSVV